MLEHLLGIEGLTQIEAIIAEVVTMVTLLVIPGIRMLVNAVKPITDATATKVDDRWREQILVWLNIAMEVAQRLSLNAGPGRGKTLEARKSSPVDD